MNSHGGPKFIADASLSGLAKWLRLLGYDTIVYSGQAGRLMMRQAQAQERILLTRRQDMMERQFSGQILLVPEASVLEQLKLVIQKLSISPRSELLCTLCLRCNERLRPLDRESVRDLVPQYVFENCIRYNQCPKCGKIYWPGTHQRNSLRYLKDYGISFPDL